MIDICIPVKNEIENLKILAKKIPKKYRVFVVSSGLDKDTSEFCFANDWNYLEFQWNGSFPKKRNWFLDNHYSILSDWILFLDADEHITASQLESLLSIVQKNSASYDAYLLKYTIYFLGKKLKFSPPMTKISLIRKELRYEKIDERNWSSLDMEVHEHPIVENKKLGKISEFKIDHNENRLIRAYVDKHNSYSDWEAHRMTQTSSDSFRSFKYRLIGRIWMPRLYFIYIYIFRFAFLDGKEGYLFAKFKEFYFISIIAKKIEQNI